MEMRRDNNLIAGREVEEMEEKKNTVWREHDKILNLMVKNYFLTVGNSFLFPP